MQQVAMSSLFTSVLHMVCNGHHIVATGWIARDDAKMSLSVADRIWIVPNHSCPVANLTTHYDVISPRHVGEEAPVVDSSKRDNVGRADIWTTWHIEARGCVH